MLAYRRIAILIVGIWLGISAMTDIAILQNFKTIDRFLTTFPAHQNDRTVLRSNAAEENNFLFENVERGEIALGILLLIFLGLDSHRTTAPVGIASSIAIAMLAILIAQHFYFSPTIADLGRRLPSLPETDPLHARFWALHGISSGAEIAKLAGGFILALKLCFETREEARGR